MKNILVLTDFSIKAQYAAEFATQIAKKVKANIFLCHAMELVESAPMAEQMAWPIADHINLKQESLSDLKELAKYLDESLPDEKEEFRPTITCLNDFGRLSVVAADFIAEQGVDLVVMGAHKSNGLARFLFGSHTHDVLDTINCPVLLVPESLKYIGISSIAYATDLTFSDLNVINYLACIAKPFNAEILVSHISPHGVTGLQGDKSILHSLNELLAQDHPKVLYTSIKGNNIPQSLLGISAAGKIDLLTLVHKRYGFFEGLFHSSVSKQLANTAKMPLLILPYSFSQDTADLTNDQLDHFCYETGDLR